ncbi:MAG: NADH-quinone oxidoreductase subunit H [Candidatus Bathyarchaeia archaeon]
MVNLFAQKVIPWLLTCFAPLIGGLLMGVDRKLTARMQSRMGPPLIQPLYDVIKLWGKEPFIASGLQPVLAFSYFGFAMAAFAQLALGMDILLIIFTAAIADVCLIVAAYNSKSPYSYLGGRRELLVMLTYEPVMLFMAFSIYLVTGSFLVRDVFNFNTPLLLLLPLSFFALEMILILDLKKSPYDVSGSGHAHQELVRGVFTEFSGYTMALIELGHWTKVVLMLGFATLFWAPNIIIGAALALLLFLVTLLIDNSYPRLNWRVMLRNTWMTGFLLILSNIIILKVMGVI